VLGVFVRSSNNAKAVVAICELVVNGTTDTSGRYLKELDQKKDMEPEIKFMVKIGQASLNTLSHHTERH
jgi:hypothetical protein